MDSSPRKTALFGLVTPMVGSGEEVFVPPSVSRIAAMSPAYSPYPINEAVNEAASELALPEVVHISDHRKRRRSSVVVKRRRQRRTTQRSTATIDREVRKRNDPYYASRFDSTVCIDEHIRSMVDFFGSDFFFSKNIYISNCGVGLVAFYIAAFLSPSHVVAADTDSDMILENCMQLRKFKHDGVPVAAQGRAGGDIYPKLSVRRCGVVRPTNKPWLVQPEYRYEADEAKKKFPFNIEFRCSPAVEAFDIVIDLVGGESSALHNNVGPRGWLIVRQRKRPACVPDGFSSTQIPSRTLHVYQRN